MAFPPAEYLLVLHIFEGQRVADLKWGTPDAKDAVLRFTFTHPGNYIQDMAIAIRNQPLTRSFIIPFRQLNTEQKKTWSFAIPGCTDGVWPTTSGTGFSIAWVYVAGTNHQTATPGVWAAGNFLRGAAVEPFTNDLVYISEVGFYCDPYKTGVAPPFVVPDVAAELRRCQRYWYRGYGLGGIVTTGTTAGRGGMRHPVPMRTTPIGTIRGAARMYDGAVTTTLTQINTVCNAFAAEFDMIGGGTFGTGGKAAQVYYQSDDVYIEMNARL